MINCVGLSKWLGRILVGGKEWSGEEIKELKGLRKRGSRGIK